MIDKLKSHGNCLQIGHRDGILKQLHEFDNAEIQFSLVHQDLVLITLQVHFEHPLALGFDFTQEETAHWFVVAQLEIVVRFVEVIPYVTT